MDVATARLVLGVSPSATAAELRAAYRARLRDAHPDLRGHDAGTAEVVAAYRVLREAEPEPLPEPSPSPPEASLVVVDGDTVVADLPPGDLFGLLVEAGHAIGDVAYVDARAGIVEVVVDIAGHGACSVLWTLEPGGRAWCAVEPLGGGPPPPVGTVAALLADGLRSVTGP